MYLYIPVVFFLIMSIVQHRRRHIINKFYDADALTSSTAKSFNEVGETYGLVAKLMLHRGVLQSTDQGRYYISLSRIEALDRRSLTRLKYIAGAAMLFLLAAGIYWLMR